MPTTEAVIERLWETPKRETLPDVWAVLDGARDARIHKMARSSTADVACLYSGDITPELKEVAPYLVGLGPRMLLTRDVVRLGWGREWGIFLMGTTSVDTMRRHLKKFLRVKDERGRIMMFRYYDPFVLRAYLPTCTPEELKQFFGPIEAFMTEGDEPETMVRFRLWNGELEEETVEVG